MLLNRFSSHKALLAHELDGWTECITTLSPASQANLLRTQWNTSRSNLGESRPVGDGLMTGRILASACEYGGGLSQL